jgi:L,D-peptidoglycan transpeptidase YkuD (ErfK/YbiS/YcfS/YnhG family)
VRRATRLTLAAASALAVAVPLSPATAARPENVPAEPTSSAAATGVARPAAAPAVAPAVTGVAPAIPGVRRYTGHIPAGVRQVIVVSARSWSSTSGTLTAYARSGSGWVRLTTMPARLGSRGLVLASRRVQGSRTTPAGSFSMTETFGRAPDPGTAMPYVRVTSDHWWVQDRRSAYYNQMRRGSAGGFALTQSGYYGSEHLISKGAQYDYAAVIDFNRPHPVVGRGSGIFLHANGDITTVGCVSIERARMAKVLRWLTPTARPWIIIGEDGWLNAA